MKSVVFDLYQEAARRKGIFVAQTEVDEITLAESKDQGERDAALTRLMSTFKDVGSPEVMKPWFDKQMHVYWTVSEWGQAMKAFPFVVGTRFHGTMAALHVGTPAVCICHDSRTTEMCEFLGIPNVALKDIEKLDVAAMRASADFAELGKRYEELYVKYQGFLLANGLLANLT